MILKDEIITCISLQILRKEPGKGNIICLVGSPGVGKTFFASVVAQALGKKFVSISLGGMHTESDLRGHRSTFVGAYPGGIVESLCTAGTFDPVILLDEIDKMGNSPYHGDPIAVLLKILDPNENHNFTDHYLSSKVPLDLSKVTFICTANREEDIPVTLKSRMKTILIADYDDKEKRLLLEEYLKPKVFNSDKVYKMYKIEERVFFSYDVYDAMVERVGKNEAGVRKLENYLSSVVAKAFLKSIEVEKKGGEKGVFVTKDNINEFSGLAEVRVNTDNPIVIVNK